MSVNGDVSEQVVRLSLEGFEILARLTGSGAKNVAAMIYTIMKDKKQTKGKIRLNNMLFCLDLILILYFFPNSILSLFLHYLLVALSAL